MSLASLIDQLARVKIDVQQLDSAVSIIGEFANVVAGRSERKPLVGGVAVANISNVGSVECDCRRVSDLTAVVFKCDVRWFDCDRVHDESIADQAGVVK